MEFEGRRDEDERGTLVRGADGELYFIPDEHMRRFRIDEDTGAWARGVMKVAEDRQDDTADVVSTLYDWTNLQLRLDSALHGVTRFAVADNSPTKAG